MTVQEYTTVKTIIYACSTSVYQNGERVAYAGVIASLDKIFADELGVKHEKMLRKIWHDKDEAQRELEKRSEESSEKESSAANFLMKIIGRGK